MVQNLAQLKRALVSGARFVILEHYIFPERSGEVRVVQKMQTNGMYTGIYGHPEAEISQFNEGRGSWIAFGKASDWKFEKNGEITQYGHGVPTWKIALVDNIVL